VDRPVKAPAWLMGLCGFLGDLSSEMPQALWLGERGLAVIGRRAFFRRLNEMSLRRLGARSLCCCCLDPTPLARLGILPVRLTS